MSTFKLSLILLNGLFFIATFGQIHDEKKRFFSDDSYWNTPIPKDAVVHTKSKYWINFLKQDANHENFGINLNEYTIPVYEVDSTTPTQICGNSERMKMVDGNRNSFIGCTSYRDETLQIIKKLILIEDSSTAWSAKVLKQTGCCGEHQ